MAFGLNAWILLLVAIVLEVAGTVLLKLSDGFERWHLGASAIILYGVCFLVFAHALRSLPVGVAYAIWAGAGIVAVTVIGYFALGEKLALAQAAYLVLIVIGIVGLRLTTAA